MKKNIRPTTRFLSIAQHNAGGPDSAEASQNDHEATRLHAHAQTLAETDDKGAGVVEQPTDGTPLTDTKGAGEVETNATVGGLCCFGGGLFFAVACGRSR